MIQSPGKKGLLIGWDAADWEMIDPLLQSGQMPALAQLIKGGVRGNLATPSQFGDGVELATKIRID